jgi:hypothetical protein
MTFYVSSGGSDSNNGLSQNAPFATFTNAWNVLVNNYAFASSSPVVTIQAVPGEYNESVVISGVIPGQRGPGQVIFNGSVGSPDTVQLAGDPAFHFNHGALATVQGFNLTSASDGIFANHYALIRHSGNDFGNCGQNHIYSLDSAIIEAVGNYTVSGPAGAHARARGTGSHVYITNFVLDPVHGPPSPGPTVTLNGTPAFSVGFIAAGQLAEVSLQGAIFNGAATGPQYSVTNNAVIFTTTGGTMVLPGNAPGLASSGGIYN